MKEKYKSIYSYLRGGELFVILSLALVLYLLIEQFGLFRFEPASYREVFHSNQVKLLSILIFLNTLFRCISALFQCGRWKRIGTLISFLGVSLLMAGIWTSIYTRFEGNFFRAEGQSFGGFESDYIKRSLYGGKKSSIPQIGMNFKKIRVEASADGERIEKVEADITYTGSSSEKLIDTTIRSDEPFIYDGTSIEFIDFGYAPKFVLYDPNENLLEQKALYMKLFPAGMEDYTEGEIMGYLFYIRCYPDYVDNNGVPTTKSANLNNPVFNLRIVRNRDIVYDGLLRPDGKVRFDNFVISLPEVTMWVKMRLVRDPGLPLLASAIPFLLIGAVLLFIGRRRVVR